MNTIIEQKELMELSNNKLLELTKDRGVTFYMYDKTMKDVRVKDLLGTNKKTAKFLTYTGLEIYRQTIKTIEIIDDDDCPNVLI